MTTLYRNTTHPLQIMIYSVLLGVIATAFLDLINYLQHVALNTPLTRYEFIGRWVLYMFDGQFVHESIKAAAAKPGELAMGWFGHYAIGVLFAWMLLALWKLKWFDAPKFWPALFVGLVTCAIPYFLMQPGMGSGIAGLNTPDPLAAQLKVVYSHVIFAIGLWLGGYLLRPLVAKSG